MLEQVLRPGSPKDMALRRWGFWIETFASICTPDNLALQMSPVEFFEACDERPREMAILRVVQAEMRRAHGDKVRRDREAAAARGKR